MHLPRTSLFALALLLIAAPAHAYVGPGAGMGTIAVVLGVVASALMAVLAVVWYPVKRLMKRLRKPSPDNADEAPESPDAG